MEKIRERIYLASLLHDIGRFYQLADEESVQKSLYLKDYKNEASYCPFMEGRYAHKHVLWTAQFITDYGPVFQKLLHSDSAMSSESQCNLIDLAARHHLPASQLSVWENIIKEADCLSSGMDCDSGEDVVDETGTMSRQKRMASILETIDILHNNPPTECGRMHLPVEKLHLSKDVFPNSDADMPDYAELWREFKDEFKFIQADTYTAFSETLLSLLFKYTGCIPADTVHSQDVSLYDHLKTTAALAVCLFDFQQSDEPQSHSPFLLVGADFSGIQPYIYQIVSKYAGKNLKGRSFYLHLLSDVIVRYLLKELRLFRANVVYNSGGGFYLIAPNTLFHRQKIEECIKTIETHFFKLYGTALYVAIDAIELSRDALMHQNGESLADVWGKLFTKRDLRKKSKFAEQIEMHYGMFFNPMMQGGEARRDTITGEEFAPGEIPVKKSQLLLKAVTAQQIDLGEKLRETDLIVIKEGMPLDYWEDRLHLAPADLGFTYYFLKETDLKEMKDKLDEAGAEVTILTLNGKNGNCDFMHVMAGANNLNGLEFYGGNEIGAKRLLTFEEMCTNEKFSRMGVLRMDVDNLGNIFQKGLPPSQSTLSRFAALSRSFDFFFSGYLNTIWKETAPDKSFIVYSGGDDVFIVGSWDATIQLAERIREDFRVYTCHNPSFSLSGGIAIVKSKFPIMKGAEESAQEEQNAKSHYVSLPNGERLEKNSISFMDTPLNWDYEFPQVKALKEELCRLLETGNLPKSFLSKIMKHYANAGIKSHRITHPKTYWMLTYDLSRMKERSGSELNSLIDCCIKEVCDKSKGTLNGKALKTNYHPLELWNFAARWAELEYRSEKV